MSILTKEDIASGQCPICFKHLAEAFKMAGFTKEEGMSLHISIHIQDSMRRVIKLFDLMPEKYNHPDVALLRQWFGEDDGDDDDEKQCKTFTM